MDDFVKCKHGQTSQFCSLCAVQTAANPAVTFEVVTVAPSGLTQAEIDEPADNGPVTWLCSTVVDDEEVAAISAGLSYISHLESKLKPHQIERVWQFLNARFGSIPAGLMD